MRLRDVDEEEAAEPPFTSIAGFVQEALAT